MNYTVTFDDAAARRALGGLSAKTERGPGRQALLGVLGRTAERALRRHFLWAEESKPNRQGFKRSHFWSRIRSATAYDPARTTDDSAVVVIADPALNAHLYGGTWGAKEAKYLAIPVDALAAGKRPSANLIEGVKFMPSRRGGNVAGWLYIERGKGKNAQRIFLWRLQKRVTVRRDPTALPRPEALEAELGEAAQRFLRPRNTT